MTNQVKILVKSIRAEFRRGTYVNEAQVSQCVVVEILRALEWDISNPRVVVPQYSTESGRVDFALLQNERPRIFIEVKAPDKPDDEGETQLFRYAFDEGAPMLVLTNGKAWSFYLTTAAGRPEQRLFYKLLLLDRTPETCAEILAKYLHKDRVYSGESLKSAQEHFQSKEIEREIERTIPKAWREILTEPDELLRDLLVEKVTDMCGHSPSLEDAEKFLQKWESNSFSPLPNSPSSPSPTPAPLPSVGAPDFVGRITGFSYKGKTKRNNAANYVLEDILIALHLEDGDFLPRLSRHHRTVSPNRRLVAQSREELYRRPHLRRFSRQFTDGWWFGTNLSQVDIVKYARIACEVANVQYDSELKLILR